MSKLDLDYFIKKVENTNEKSWCSGVMSNNGSYCMLGHCGISTKKWVHNEESASLTNLVDLNSNVKSGDEFDNENMIIKLNDRFRFSNDKLRGFWLDYLTNLKNN